MNRYEKHQLVLNETMLALQYTFGNDVVIFKRHTGVFPNGRGGFVRVSTNGQADLWGWVKNLYATYPIEIEIKTGSAIANLDQKRWEKTCLRFNVLYFIVRENGVDQFIKDLCQKIK